jgi:rhombotail lipoprotein
VGVLPAMNTTPAWTALLCGALTMGCAMKSAVMIEAKAPDGPDAVLDHSLYAKDGSGSLTEAQLQEILRMPIDLQFPARVGVVALADAFDPTGDVSMATRGVAARDLAFSLSGSPQYSHVSDISTELPHVGGIEGLRVIAARYRLRYLLLYSERFVDDTHANGWAFLYPTIIGMFVAPGVTVESHGIAQVDLLDVRTGTILFTVMEPMNVSSQTFMIGAAREHREEQLEAASAAAIRLAKRVGNQTNALVAFAEQDDSRTTRYLVPPIAEEKPLAHDDTTIVEEAVLP